MRLTEKDREFLSTLHKLMAKHDDIYVDLCRSPGEGRTREQFRWREREHFRGHFRGGQPGYMVLRGNYGRRIDKAFGMTRQGVRWRFQRLFNDVYINAFTTILLIETVFGPQLREHAVRISQERHALRQSRQVDRREVRSADQSRHAKARESPEQAHSPGDLR